MNWLFEYIKNLQQKSFEERKRAAFLGAAIISSVIFLIWLSTALTFGLSSKTKSSNSQAVDLSPLQTIGQGVSDIFASVRSLGKTVEKIQYANPTTTSNFIITPP